MAVNGDIKHSHLTAIIAELADAIKHVNRFDEELQQRYHLRNARESAREAVRLLDGLCEEPKQ